MHHKHRGVRALLVASSLSGALRCPHLPDVLRRMLQITLVAVIQADLVAEQVLYLLPSLVLVLAIWKKRRLVGEALLLAQDDITLLSGRMHLHVPRQGRLKGAVAHVRLSAYRGVSSHAQSRWPADHAARKATRRHEALLGALIVGSNRRVELPVLWIPVLVIVLVFIVPVLASQVTRSSHRMRPTIARRLRVLPYISIRRVSRTTCPLAARTFASLQQQAVLRA